MFRKQSIFKEKTYWIDIQSTAQRWFLLASYRLKVISSTNRRQCWHQGSYTEGSCKVFLATGTKNLHAFLALSHFHMERLGYFTGVRFLHPRQLFDPGEGGGLIPDHGGACYSWGPQNLPSRQRKRPGPSSHTSTWHPHGSVPHSRHPNWSRWHSKGGFIIIQVLNKCTVRRKPNIS